MRNALLTAVSVVGLAIVTTAQGPGRGPAQTQSPRPLVGETMPIGGDTVEGTTGPSRSIVFDDGNGFLVELVQPTVLPTQVVGQAVNPPRSFVYGLDTTITVADIEKSAQFFRDVFGLQVTVDPAFHADPKRLQTLGLRAGQYREATVAWPDRTPQLNLVQFSGIEQKTLTPLVADPNATMMRLFVSDMAPILAKVSAFPDAKIMNVSSGPSPQNGVPWLVVRLPGGSTYLQIVGLANGRVG